MLNSQKKHASYKTCKWDKIKSHFNDMENLAKAGVFPMGWKYP